MVRSRLNIIPMFGLCALLGGFGSSCARGQSAAYVLLTGSDLTDDCLICDRVSLPVPLQGTFQLMQVEQTPLFTRYQLTNIAFQTTSTNGRVYTLTGSGTYQVGGEVAVQQDLSLNLQINDGATNASCLFTNAQAQVKSPWPEIQAAADQSNGSFVRLYRLRLMAAPLPRFSSIQAVPSTATVRLEWQSFGAPIQVERGEAVKGPYSLIATNVTAQQFEDHGVLTNQLRSFYRLNQQW